MHFDCISSLSFSGLMRLWVLFLATLWFYFLFLIIFFCWELLAFSSVVLSLNFFFRGWKEKEIYIIHRFSLFLPLFWANEIVCFVLLTLWMFFPLPFPICIIVNSICLAFSLFLLLSGLMRFCFFFYQRCRYFSFSNVNGIFKHFFHMNKWKSVLIIRFHCLLPSGGDENLVIILWTL